MNGNLFKFSLPKEHTTITSKVPKVKTITATVNNDDTVTTKAGVIVEIDSSCISIRKRKVYYLKIDSTGSHISQNCHNGFLKIMVQDPILGENHNARPYRPGLTVDGYVTNGGKFNIVNIVHSEMNYTHVEKPGLIE